MEKYIPENELDQVSGGAMVDNNYWKTGYCPHCKTLTKFFYTDDAQAKCKECGNSYAQSYIDQLYLAYKAGNVEDFLRDNPVAVF